MDCSHNKKQREDSEEKATKARTKNQPRFRIKLHSRFIRRLHLYRLCHYERHHFTGNNKTNRQMSLTFAFFLQAKRAHDQRHQQLRHLASPQRANALWTYPTMFSCPSSDNTHSATPSSSAPTHTTISDLDHAAGWTADPALPGRTFSRSRYQH